MNESSSTLPYPYSDCFICKSAELQPWLSTWDRNQRVDDRRYEIKRCPSCGLGYTIHLLSIEEMGHYYPRVYYSLKNSREMEQSRASRKYRRTRVRRIQRYVPGGLLLDVGAGAGTFVKSAAESGFHAEGLELSKEAAEFGRTAWGLDITQGDLHTAALSSDHYDVVTLSHVFEHFYDPLAAARKLHSILKSGGVLVLSVPNIESLQARLFLQRWYHLDVPRHLFHYTPRSLKALAEMVGFTILDVDFFSAEHNWAGILGSMMQLNPPREGLPHKAVRKLVGVPVAKGAAYLEAAVGCGGTFELYARK